MSDREISGLSRRHLFQRLAIFAGAARLGDVAALPARAATREAPNFVEFVNPLQGTNSNFDFSRGNTLPLVGLPFGMTYWSLQTSENGGWYFDPAAGKTQGIRATRQPSPWIGDYGKFTILPQAGEPIYAPADRAAAYRSADLQVQPHYQTITFAESGIHTELTPTERCAIFRFTFPQPGKARVLIDAYSQVAVGADGKSLSGFSRTKSGGAPDNFAGYFYAEFDKPFTSVTVLNNHQPEAGATTLEAKDKKQEVGISAEFMGPTTVTMRVATSFISIEQAKINLHREVGDTTFDDLRAAGARAWNATLGVIELDASVTDRERRIFYSCLYRAHLFPRMLHEPGEGGKPIHYSPYDGRVHPGVLYGDTGLWDGYHTLYPLLSLIQPARFGEMIEGFLNAYREGGWLPQWPSPGTRGGMGGTHSDAIIADAILKNIPGFDREIAYAAARKNAFTQPGNFVFEGRQQLKAYRDNGFRPNTVSNSLDYAYDDACIALAAKALDKTDDYALLAKRSQNYQRLYNPETGFMQAKNADGTWKTPFDPYSWSDAYTEGAAWQWTWAVPHDPAGLMSLMGGQKPFLAKLDRMLLQPSTYRPGGPWGVIHEMREMAAFPFGQYAQGNQPAHQALTLFAAAGCPWKTAYWMRRVATLCYSPNDFPGDEDNGEMASWYILAALGIFPSCVGHPSYVIASPLYREARIHLANGKTLTLRAPRTSRENVYVNGVKVNGKSRSALTLAHAELAAGGTVDFEMGAFPKERTIAPADLPFAFSPYPAITTNTADSRLTAIRISCGGDNTADSMFVGDCFYSGGNVVSQNGESARQGTFTYTIPLPMLPGNRPYTVRLHFASPPESNRAIAINGQQYLPSPRAAKAPPATLRAIYEYTKIRPERDGMIVLAISGTLHAIEIEST